MLAFDKHKGFREAIVLHAARVTHVASDSRARLQAHQHRRDVLAFDVAMDALRLAINRARFTEEKSRRVQDMTANVGENELLQLLEERLILEHRKTVAVIDARPE